MSVEEILKMFSVEPRFILYCITIGDMVLRGTFHHQPWVEPLGYWGTALNWTLRKWSGNSSQLTWLCLSTNRFQVNILPQRWGLVQSFFAGVLCFTDRPLSLLKQPNIIQILSYQSQISSYPVHCVAVRYCNIDIVSNGRWNASRVNLKK